MALPEEEIILKKIDYLVTETVFNPQATFHEIQEFMQKSATSGNAELNMGAGGVRRVLLVEKTKLNDKQSQDVRRVIGARCEVKVA